MTIAYDANDRDANGYACCATCGYAYCTPACDNPACDANPSVSEETKARRRAETAKRREDEARWEADRLLKQRARNATVRHRA